MDILVVKHCEICGGTGKVDLNKCKKEGCMVYHPPNVVDCEDCKGSGHIIGSV